MPRKRADCTGLIFSAKPKQVVTAVSPLSPATGAKRANARPAGRRSTLRNQLRAWRREFIFNWLGPLTIVIVLAACFQAGMFVQSDGRFFDFVSVNQASTSPKVVVIERDAPFEGRGPQRFHTMERELARLGVERIGYLSAPDFRIGTTKVPVVAALPAKPLPENRSWQLEMPDRGIGNAAPTARAMPASDYGIHRKQLASLSGRQGNIPVFDAALAGASSPPDGEFFVSMPRQQNIPVLRASQVLDGEMAVSELQGLVAMIVTPSALKGTLATPISPNHRTMSEAIFRAHAVNTIRSNRASNWIEPLLAWSIMLVFGVILALVYRRSDPKQLAIATSLAFTILVAAAGAAAILATGIMLPVTALIAAAWIISFERILKREASQDRRLERTASHALQASFPRTALREGARLPHFLGTAAQYAGVERSLIIELLPNGKLELIAANNASMDDIAITPKQLNAILRKVKENFAVRDASDIVPGWQGEARIGWVGEGEKQLFWLHTKPQTATPGKSAHLVRALVGSFRRVLRWRGNLHARTGQDRRYLPVDDKVASAIALVASESEQVRRGFDTIETAIVIFHLIGTPLHANTAMREIYREAGLSVFDSSLAEVLLELSELEKPQVDALIEDMMLNGSEMRMPMRDLGKSQRLLRIAAPSSHAHGGDRILVLEAIDMRNVNRIAELRKAVGKFVDLQLRNDFEAILLASQLASDKRLGPELLAKVVGEIGKTARRAAGRLDDVAHLVRSDRQDLTHAWYPVDATAVVTDAIARVSGFAEELGVSIEAQHPGLSGFTIAEPVALGDMIVAMLRVVIADTPHGGAVKLKLEELEGRTLIRISGGFGIGFGRLLWLISNHEEGAVGEYKVIGEAMTKVTSWSATVSYWGSEANGFGFNIDMQGVG